MADSREAEGVVWLHELLASRSSLGGRPARDDTGVSAAPSPSPAPAPTDRLPAPQAGTTVAPSTPQSPTTPETDIFRRQREKFEAMVRRREEEGAASAAGSPRSEGTVPPDSS